MKKVICILITLIFAVSLVACGSKTVDGYKLDLGKSKLYSEEERKACIPLIMEKFNGFVDKCTMISISYAGDEEFNDENMMRANDISYDEDKTDYDQCIVFVCDFKTPPKTNGNLQSNKVYKNFRWLLGRRKTADNKYSDWEIVIYGLAE